MRVGNCKLDLRAADPRFEGPDPFELTYSPPRSPSLPGSRYDGLHHVAQLVEIDGLGQVSGCASLHAPLAVALHGKGGYGDYGEQALIGFRAQNAKNLETAHIGKSDIQEHRVG